MPGVAVGIDRALAGAAVKVGIDARGAVRLHGVAVEPPFLDAIRAMTVRAVAPAGVVPGVAALVGRQGRLDLIEPRDQATPLDDVGDDRLRDLPERRHAGQYQDRAQDRQGREPRPAKSWRTNAHRHPSSSKDSYRSPPCIRRVSFMSADCRGPWSDSSPLRQSGWACNRQRRQNRSRPWRTGKATSGSSSKRRRPGSSCRACVGS